MDEIDDGIGVFVWRAGRDSNTQPPDPKSGALSIEPPARREGFYRIGGACGSAAGYSVISNSELRIPDDGFHPTTRPESDAQPAICNLQSAIRNSQFAIRNGRLGALGVGRMSG